MTQSYGISPNPGDEQIARATVASIARSTSALGFVIRGVGTLEWLPAHGLLFGRVDGLPGATIALRRVEILDPDRRPEVHVVAVLEIPTPEGRVHLDMRARAESVDVAAGDRR